MAGAGGHNGWEVSTCTSYAVGKLEPGMPGALGALDI